MTAIIATTPWRDGNAKLTNGGYSGVEILDANGLQLGLVKGRELACYIARIANNFNGLVEGLRWLLEIEDRLETLGGNTERPRTEWVAAIKEARKAYADATEEGGLS